MRVDSCSVHGITEVKIDVDSRGSKCNFLIKHTLNTVKIMNEYEK